MAYEVLARKWRPQQFDDVVGQAHVTETLKNAIAADRIAHAYLFVGPRGIGKTSVARIFAKALNCEKGPTGTPCDICDSCREIMNGSNLDVLEVDGASNNGVENVRDLRDAVKYAPTGGRYKIYIIDEVHMLSTAAFNALLKTLEEPPDHVKFFFATTEPEKVLPTIISRCQRFDLRRIPVAGIMERLQHVASAEGIEICDDALLGIARGAEGGLRDAESALDQLISFKGTKIEEDDVLSVFGLVSRRLLEDLAAKVLEGDVGGVVALVAELDEAGKDLKRVVLELMAYFRNLLVYMAVPDAGESLDLTATQIEVLKPQAALTDTDRLLRVMQILTDAEDRMRYTLSLRILLETALIRCCRASVVVSLEAILKRIRTLAEGCPGADEGAGGAPTVAMPEPAVPKAPAAPPARVPAKPIAATSGGSASARSDPRPGGAATAPVVGSKEELALLEDAWQTITDKVGRMALPARRCLPDARPLRIEESRVTIGFDAEFADEIEQMTAPRAKKGLEKALSEVLKRDVAAAFESVPGLRDSMSNADRARPGRTAAGQAKQEAVPGRPIVDDPAVQKTLEMFGGSVRDVRR